MPNTNKVAIITGSAGFIGFHISNLLLEKGWSVVGIDCISDYYDVKLKRDRISRLENYDKFYNLEENIQTPGFLQKVFKEYKPEIVIHLAAQAGVRYSTLNPRIYIDTNILGAYELLEASRSFTPKHLLLASTSSVYGANDKMPFSENDRTDHQVSIYAATKKSSELLAHTYSHLFSIPITIFRFFTVYGPWGRPDMALFKFTKAIIDGEPIDVYNHGNMLRDFTYIDDLTTGIFNLSNSAPRLEQAKFDEDSISPVAPFRCVNLGNSKPEKLLKFIETIEGCLGRKAIKNFLPLQQGDVLSTWADTTLMSKLIETECSTSIEEGVQKFISWYKEYYQI